MEAILRSDYGAGDAARAAVICDMRKGVWGRCPSGMEVSRLLKGKADVLKRSEHTPTDDAPTSGRYELLNVFGTPTGEGERLPAAPLSYTWRLVAVDEHLEVARRRVLEAEKRIAHQVSLIQQIERKWHAEIAKIARSLLRALQDSLEAANSYVERLKALPR